MGLEPLPNDKKELLLLVLTVITCPAARERNARSNIQSPCFILDIPLRFSPVSLQCATLTTETSSLQPTDPHNKEALPFPFLAASRLLAAQTFGHASLPTQSRSVLLRCGAVLDCACLS
jgi:hypothetical protein